MKAVKIRKYKAILQLGPIAEAVCKYMTEPRKYSTQPPPTCQRSPITAPARSTPHSVRFWPTVATGLPSSGVDH